MGWGRCLLVSMLVACVDTTSFVCPDNATVCPDGSRCAFLDEFGRYVCAFPEQDSCAGLPDLTECIYNDEAGLCYSGVCVVTVCGNGLQELGEQCDDGNVTPRDNCSARCSNEQCGNGRLDLDVDIPEECDDNNLFSHDGCSSGCRIEFPVWRELSIALPSSRTKHAMAFDHATGKTLLFGGGVGATFLGDTWEWNGFGWAEHRRTFAPHPRKGHAMAYDGKRKRVVLFGGEIELGGGTALADTWEWDGKRWHLMNVPSGSIPGARAYHALAYDPVREKVVMFGGDSLTLLIDPLYQDTWEWDGATWTEVSIAPPRPPKLANHAMAYDPILGQIVLFGGRTATQTHTNETWTLTTAGSWQSHAPSAPVRIDATLGFDGIGVVMIGGEDSTNTLGDIRRWNGSTWQLILNATRLTKHAVAFDSIRSILVVASGGTTSVLTQEWNRMALAGTNAVSVGALQGSSFAHDPASRRTWLVGGCDAACVDTTFAFVDGAVTKPTGSGLLPPARGDAAMAYHAAEKRFVLFGGQDSALFGDTWEMETSGDIVQWLRSFPSPEPTQRRSHAMTYDAANSRVVLFGGQDVDGLLNDTWTWSGGTWSPVSGDAPSPRSGAAIGYDPRRAKVVLFGGSEASLLDDLYELDGNDWRRVIPIGPSPNPRTHARFAWNPARARLVLSGGNDNPTWFDDAWEWDGTRWTLLDAVGLRPRSGHATFPSSDGSGVVITGGTDVVGALADTWLLRWESETVDDFCRDQSDGDGDGAAKCLDGDCWAVCTPLCEPWDIGCLPTQPYCGDGICDPLESPGSCPVDCIVPVCGDFTCTGNETLTTCPGDCTP